MKTGSEPRHGPSALALSYVDAYVDFTGRVTGYTVADLPR